MTKCPIVVLTGGPGGGKSTLIDELRHDSAWVDRFIALPEAISLMRYLNISRQKKLFQRVLVHLQIALENGLQRAFNHVDPLMILCHRGSLDPLAYWIDRGWSEEAFFTFTGTQQEKHYQRYTAVLHLVIHKVAQPKDHRDSRINLPLRHLMGPEASQIVQAEPHPLVEPMVQMRVLKRPH